MSEERALFQATFCKMIQVQGRKVVQFVFEVPTEAADQALRALGGYQATINETWVVVARLDPKAVAHPPERPEKAKKGSLARQAAMACEEPAFKVFLKERFAIGAREFWPADFVREVCAVKSRAEFDKDPEAGKRWSELHTEYLVWAQQ